MGMQEPSTRKIYDIQSNFYDATFGRLVRRRVATAIGHLRLQPGQRVLDIGIGTGQSLQHYPAHARVVGIDLSPGMLREARQKILRHGWGHVAIVRANALQLPFDADQFDHVFISHVISVVSDPVALLREAQRVARPQARIVIVNHFLSDNPLIALIEKWASPLCTKLGWRSDLALQDLLRSTGAQVRYRYKLESIDLWETVVMNNNKRALAV